MAGRQYEIHIKRHLSPCWADWLNRMLMCCLENGAMILLVLQADQAARLGILNKLNSLNLCILSVDETDRRAADQTVRNKHESESERNKQETE